MHPEIRLPSPGGCPKCGMTLKRVMPSMDHHVAHEAVHSVPVQAVPAPTTKLADGTDLHLPDAPGNSATFSWKLSENAA